MFRAICFIVLLGGFHSLAAPLLDDAANVSWSFDGRLISILTQQAGQLPELSIVSSKTGRRRAIRWPQSFNHLKSEDFRIAQWDKQSLFVSSEHAFILVNTSNGRSRLLFTSDRPVSQVTLSPDGKQAAFCRDNHLERISTESGRVSPVPDSGNLSTFEPSLNAAFSSAESAPAKAYSWAPDSSRLALIASRKGANRVLVIDLEAIHSRPIEIPGSPDDYIPHVDWLPDGKNLLIECLNKAQNQLTLFLADPSTGTTRLILVEHDRYWINVPAKLHLLANGDQLLWSSERSGHRHLYLYSLEPKLERQVTDGLWDVTAISYVDEAAKLIYFISTKDGAAQRQLYRVSFDGTGLTRITDERGTHLPLFAPGGHAYVDTYSTAVHPPQQNLVEFDGRQHRNLSANKQAEKSTEAEAQFFPIRSHDGATLDAMLVKPASFDSQRKYPVIVFANGGPGEQAAQDKWLGAPSRLHQMLLSRGFLIFALDYRGSDGHGHAFEAPIHFRLGSQELSDLHDGVRQLQQFPFIDQSRIAIWGAGYGGFVAISALFKEADLFKAGAAISPVTDWKLQKAAFPERYLGAVETHRYEYKESSPLSAASHLRGKLLVQAGVDDNGIPFANTTELQKALDRSGRRAEIIRYPGRLNTPPNQEVVIDRLFEFFAGNL